MRNLTANDFSVFCLSLRSDDRFSVQNGVLTSYRFDFTEPIQIGLLNLNSRVVIGLLNCYRYFNKDYKE